MEATERLLRNQPDEDLRAPLEYLLELERPRLLWQLMRQLDERYGHSRLVHDDKGERWMAPCPACRAGEDDHLRLYSPLSVWDDGRVRCTACGAGMARVLAPRRRGGGEPCEVCGTIDGTRRFPQRMRGGRERWVTRCTACAPERKDRR